MFTLRLSIVSVHPYWQGCKPHSCKNIYIYFWGYCRLPRTCLSSCHQIPQQGTSLISSSSLAGRRPADSWHSVAHSLFFFFLFLTALCCVSCILAWKPCLDPNFPLWSFTGPRAEARRNGWYVTFQDGKRVQKQNNLNIYLIFLPNLPCCQSCARPLKSSTKTKMGSSAVKTWGTAWGRWVTCQQRWS